MELETWAHGVDVDTPSSARMYDYYLGGSHNFTADREAAAKVIGAMPHVPMIAKTNRLFLHRSVRYLLDQGVRQFLDIGSGIPTVGNVHEVAQRSVPDSRVVYVDVDPIAVTLARRLLDGRAGATAVLGDLRRPKDLLDHPEIRAVLDFDQPIALLMVSMLHFVPESDDPYGAVATLRAAVAPGSYLVISHGADEGYSADQASAVQGVYRTTSTPAGLRSRKQIAAFFDGFELVDPGLVWLAQWRPEQPQDAEGAERTGILAGVGRLDETPLAG